MTNYHKEMLLDLIKTWNDEQLEVYIALQEVRLDLTRTLIRDLKEILRNRKKRRKQPLENGPRGGTNE
jgi:hypothetical protein